MFRVVSRVWNLMCAFGGNLRKQKFKLLQPLWVRAQSDKWFQDIMKDPVDGDDGRGVDLDDEDDEAEGDDDADDEEKEQEEGDEDKAAMAPKQNQQATDASDRQHR